MSVDYSKEAIEHRIRTQDNRMTSYPMPCVREKAKGGGWDIVTVCITTEGAEDFIRKNGHNLDEPHVYIASGWRNAEWKAVREILAPGCDGPRSEEVGS